MARELNVGALPLGLSVFAEREDPLDRAASERAPTRRTARGRRLSASDIDELLSSLQAPAEFSCSFTREGEQASIRDELINAIASARQRVFLTSFRLGDRKLNRALIDAAHRLRGGVYVITSLDDDALRRGADRLDHTVERLEESRREIGDDEEVQEKYFGKLSREGVYIRGLRACHAKFAVIDDRVAIVSTANFETRGFDTTQECAVTLRDPAHVDALRRFFARLWYRCDMEASPGQNRYTMQNRKREIWKGQVPRPDARAPGPIWTSGADETFILEAAQDLFRGARGHLLMASFGLHDNYARPELILDPLAEAVQRGVQVDLLVRSRNNVYGHRRDASEFNRMGVRLRADALNHAKAIVADSERGALFSANLDIRHGLVDDVEVGVRLDGTPALGKIEAFLARAFDEAPYTFYVAPTHAQAVSAVRSADSRRHHWPFPAELPLRASQDDFEQLARQAASAPVLFEVQKNESCRLFAGGMSWLLVGEPDGASAHVRGRGREPQASLERLEEWLASPPRAPCGICAARLSWVGPSP